MNATATGASVVAITCPQISAMQGACGIYSDVSISEVERAWLRDRTADLDQVVKDAVGEIASERLSVLSELHAFDGHDMCADEAFVNAVVLSEPDDSFHPTAAGYSRMAEHLAAHVGGSLL